MTTLYSTPSGVGRHRQTEPRGEESVPQVPHWLPEAPAAPGPAPEGAAPAPLPAQATAPAEPSGPTPAPRLPRLTAVTPAPRAVPTPTAVTPAPVAVPTPVPVPVPGSLPAPVPVQVHPDPPIYQALYALWAGQGRALPGRRDAEWTRLAAAPVWADRTVRVSGVLLPPGVAR